MSNSSEHELAIRIAGRLEESFRRSMGDAQGSIERLAGAFKTAAGIAATAFAAVQVGEFASDCVNAAMDFESSMADVAKVVDGLKDENGNLTESYHEMSDALLNMSKEIPMTADELAQIMSAAGTAGVASEDLERFTETAAKMGVAFDATAEQAGEWMAIWRTALGMNQDEVEALGDQINYLGNTSSENALKISQIVTDIGSLAKISGVSAGDLAALGAATTGIDANVAATGLKNMFVAMGQGAQATKKQEEILNKLGFTAVDVAERMQIDSKAMIMDLLAEINKLPKAEQEAAISGYFGKESLATVAVLASNLGNLGEQFGKVADASKYTGSMQAEYAVRAATSANNVQLLKNRFQALQIQLGTYLLPIVNVGMEIMSEGIDILANLGEGSKEAFDKLAQGAALAGGSIKSFFERIGSGQNIVDALTGVLSDDFGIEIPDVIHHAIGFVQDFINKGQEVAAFLVGTLKNSIGNIGDKIAENEPTFQSIINLASDLKNRLFEAFENAKPAITFMAETAIPAVVDVLLKVTGGIADVTGAFIAWDGFLPTITAIGVAVGAIKFYQLITGIYSAIKAMTLLNIAKVKDMALTAAIHALYIQDAIVKAASAVQTNVVAAAQWAWNTAATAGAGVTGALGAAFMFLTSPIGLVILAIAAIIAIGALLWKNWDTVKEKAGQLGAWIGEKFGAMKEAIGNAVEGFKNKFPVAFAFIEGVFNGFKATVDGVIGGVKQIFQGAIDFVKGVFTGNWRMALDGLKNIFSGAFNALKSLAMAPLNSLGGIVTGAFNAIDTATGGKLSEMKAKASEAWENIKTTAGNAWNAVKDTAGTVLQAAKDTVDEKLNNIKAAYDAHGGGIQGVAAGAVEGVKGYFTAGLTFIDNLTNGKLSGIASYFSGHLQSIQGTVSGILEGIKNAFSEKLEAAKTVVSSAIDAIKGFFNFSWELPKLKMPHFSVTGEFSLGPPPKIPKFGVEWYKDGGIMTKPTLFGMNGNNAMVGGEAGAEAILPLAELWKNMGSFIDRAINKPSGTIGSVIQLLAQRVEDFAVGSQRTPIMALAGGMETSESVGYDDNRAGGVTIHYAPVYRFEGEAPSKTDLVAAEKMSQSEFDKMMRQWQKDKGRVKF